VFYAGKPPAVEYIELSSGAEFRAMYRGMDVFGTRAEDVVDRVATDAPFDSHDQELGYSYIFPDLELSLWRPVLPESADDPHGRQFCTIGIGVKGYYSVRA
jgi:hypothetical protein